MVHAQALGDETEVRLDHGAVAVVRASRGQTVARFAPPAIADPIWQHDEMRAGIEQLTISEQLAGEFVADELCSCAARAMQDEDGVADEPLRVAHGPAERTIVQPKLRQRFTGRESESCENEIPFHGRRVGRCAKSGSDTQDGSEDAGDLHCQCARLKGSRYSL